jgi:hypothetical protein
MSEDKNFLNKLADKGKATVNALKSQYGISSPGNAWPQTQYQFRT